MTLFRLYFVGSKSPELLETYFEHSLLPEVKQTIRGKTGGAFSSFGTFQWTRAVKSIALLFVRGAAATAADGAPHAAPHLVGGKRSLAASLDDSLHKRTAWLQDMFGLDSQGRLIARRVIKRSNPGRRRAGPVAVSVNFGFVPAKSVEIYWNDQHVTNASELEAMCIALEEGEAGPTQAKLGDNVIQIPNRLSLAQVG